MSAQAVGQRALQYIIEEKGGTGRALGQRLGCSEARVSRYKNGRERIPDDTLARLVNESEQVRFKLDLLFERRLLPVNVPRREGLNESLLAATIRVVREMGEAVDHCRGLIDPLADVPDTDVLPPDKHERLIAAGVEVLDGLMAGLCWYASVNDWAPGTLARMETMALERLNKKAG
jgi:transcriptional regulator with XRE-family HTH domain